MDGSSKNNSGPQQLLFAQQLLAVGLITADQMKAALAERAESVIVAGENAATLAEIIVANGYITQAQLDEALKQPAVDLPPPLPEAEPEVEADVGVDVPQGPPAFPASVEKLGKYKILGELGRGGMGVVHDALDTQLNRRVALKLMVPARGLDKVALKQDEDRFVQEAQLSAKLNHPGIVSVYEAGVLEGQRFLAMQLIEGKSFLEWRKDAPLHQQIKALRDVTLAVHHAHEQGILHRDLKPANILVDGSGHASVTDFGLAKMLGPAAGISLTGAGSVVGTPAYMSPEQAQSAAKVDWRTDIWSLGVILYEIMTGRPPFIGDTPLKIMMSVVNDPVTPPLRLLGVEVPPGLDSAIENICLKALAKLDKDRYVTAQAFADDLTKWLGGEEVRVVVPKARRRRGPIVAAAVAAVLLLAVVGGGTYFMTKRPSVEAELSHGRKYLKEERYAEALASFSLALTKDPGNEAARAGEGDARAGMKRKEKEVDDRKRAEEAGMRKEFEARQKELEDAKLALLATGKSTDPGLTEEQKKQIVEAQRIAREKVRLLEEAARKAAAELQKKVTLKEAGFPMEEAWKKAEPLATRTIPLRHAVQGMWELKDMALSSDAGPYARIEIPYEPPAEYDLRVRFTRRAGAEGVCVMFPVAGKPYVCELGGTPGSEAPSDGNGEGRLQFLENNRMYTAVFQVRQAGVRAWLDGEFLIQRMEAPADGPWKLPHPVRLALGAHGSPTTFHGVEVIEVSGRGRTVGGTPPGPLKSLSPAPTGLKPGLIGEYFFGMNFEVLAARQIDEALNVFWGDGSPWKGGAVDAFSVRWSGYLNVPRTAVWTFTAATEDLFRVVIDGVQIAAGLPPPGGAPAEFSGALERGLHRLEVEFVEKSRNANFLLSWVEGEASKAAPLEPKNLLHDPSKFEKLAARPPPGRVGQLTAHTNGVTSLSCSPDGGLMVSAGEDRALWLWDTAGRKNLGALAKHPSGILAVAFSPDVKSVAAGGYDNIVRLWDPLARTELRSMEGHSAMVVSLAFSPDGRTLASGSYDRTVRLWDPATGREIRILPGHEGGVTAVAFSPDGKRVAAAGEGRAIRVWEAATGREVLTLAGLADNVLSLAFSPDGKTLAAGGGDFRVRLFEAETGKERRAMAGHAGAILSLSYSADGTLLASGGRDAIIRVWDVGTGAARRVLAGHTSHVTSLAFAGAGRTLVSGSLDATLFLWDLSR